ncbi:MAG: DNA primase [Candidatus Bathyarchaeia archaeon]|jgi:DNA primase catalytic subunit
MGQYYLPAGMRFSTLGERKEFYTEEFDINKVADWFGGKLGYTRFAVIMGRHTKIILPQYKEDAETTIIIDEYKDLADVKAQVVDFLPEAVYYDRNVYDEDGKVVGQELAFDLDPENVTCPIHGTLADKMARNQGLSFCEIELKIVQKEARDLYEYLAKRFSDLRVTYSGRGFHIHVMDKDTYQLTTQQRLELAKEVKKGGFEIDEWVTTGEYRLIRLPYSLNGLVSRIVLPLKKEETESFDAIHDRRCLPQFLSKATF